MSVLAPDADWPPEVDVAWLQRVVPDPAESNHSRWPTDPTWAVVQVAMFTDAPLMKCSY